MRLAAFVISRVITVLIILFWALDAAAQPFELRTTQAGLGGVTASNGVSVADFDGDGVLDVYFVAPGSYQSGDPSTWNRLFRGLGDGRYMDVTQQAGVEGRDSGSVIHPPGTGDKLGASWGDYDNDGDPDLYLTHSGPNQLYRNDGDGTFTDVTTEAGVAGGDTHISSSALWFDMDLDGDLDLYVGVWEDYPRQGQQHDRVNPLFENLGDGTFADATAAGAGDIGQTYTTLALDVSGDGLPDLYNANDFGANRLYVQDGEGGFVERTAEYGLENDSHGMGLAVGDPNMDGRFDIFLTNITGDPAAGSGESHALFIATEAGGFIDMAAAAGVAETHWGWGTEFFDMDSDGDEDLFVVNGYFDPNAPNTLFENVTVPGGSTFNDVTTLFEVGNEQAGRGLVVFDQNADGRLDLLVSNIQAGPLLYRNTTSSGTWLVISLEGTASNRSALGAVVEVETEDRTFRRLNHGAQYLGQNLIPVYIGLGDAEAVLELRIEWPSGHVDELGPGGVNRIMTVREAEGIVSERVVGLEQRADDLPRSASVGANFPNPFTHSTRIPVRLAGPASVTLQVVDVLGRIVYTDSRRIDAPGPHSFEWTPGAAAPRTAGVYVYHITVDGRQAGSGLMTLLLHD